ncbi:MAG TPA: hypothetical protein VG028_10310 [Terriglobia bacterium]|nr:hypothetical protein [Terriglobia bacterium]
MSLISYPADEDRQSEAVVDPTSLSKRAARRLFQRAFVLAGRDRNVRQHIREAHCALLWMIEDWDFAWTIFLDKGKIEFDRRPTKRPDLTLSWPTAEEFFKQVEKGSRKDDAPARTGDSSVWKFAQPVYSGFCAALRQVLRDPVDENGVRLA